MLAVQPNDLSSVPRILMVGEPDFSKLSFDFPYSRHYTCICTHAHWKLGDKINFSTFREFCVSKGDERPEEGFLEIK